MLAGGDLIDILVHTDVQRYLQFQQIAGSYVWLRASGLYKVPATEMEALSSGLLGLFQKGKVTAFLHYVKAADPDDPTTWGSGYPLDRLPCRRVFADYGLDSNSQDMLGHALALHSDDSYLDRPAVDTFRRIRLYMNSLARFGKSPYVYPLYGLGELPQAFARLSAIYGGTYVLSCPLHSVRLDDGARVSTVCLDVPSAFSSAPPEATNPNSSGQQRKWIKCRRGVIAHPSYFPERVRQTHRVVRAICLMDHAIPKTNQSDSCQIIIPQRQLNRHSGISFALLTLMDERE
jgi:Rab GDP dissociation inhibitor